MLKAILKRWVLRACLNEGSVLDDTWVTVHNKEQKTGKSSCSFLVRTVEGKEQKNVESRNE